MRNWIFIFVLLLLSSCKLRSLISDSEFKQHGSALENINGTYILNQEVNDSLDIHYIYQEDKFYVYDLVKDEDKESLRDRCIESLTILYDGNDKIVFRLFDGKENFDYTYKCKRQEDYLEIYFKKKRIWALPLFMTYQYDRLRLGLDDDSNLVVHKWKTALATLTIMPFDSWGHKDYRYSLSRLTE